VGSLMVMGPVIDNFEYPKWYELYQRALVELDRGAFRVRVAAAEAACFRRLQIMSSTGEVSSERHAIEDALGSLRVLKRETLGLCDSTGPSDQTGRQDFISMPVSSCCPTSGSTPASQHKRQPIRCLTQWVIDMCSALPFLHGLARPRAGSITTERSARSFWRRALPETQGSESQS
jgi:hypothetical protein